MARWLTRWLPAPARPRARGIRLSVEALEDRLTPYAVNLPDAPANPVHEDLTQDGFELFVRQFGKSDLNSMSDVITQLRTGARDEDNKNSEPFFDSSPSLRHFWNHDVAYNRTLSGGLGLGLESAPARALRILGLEGGIVSLFATDPDKAARYLGHVAHLLQDMTVPAHVHADPHYDGSSGTLPGGIISVTDFDPYHDYVDGVQFSTAGVFRVDSTYTASFDLAAGSRHQGFAAMADTDDGKGLRDPDQFPVFAGDRLVGLFAENAREAELYDTKDYVGRGNTSILFDRNRPIVVDTPTAVGIRQYFPAAAYSSFTQDELVAQATDLVPRAVRTTAELFRYFYSLSDTAAPTVDLPRLTSTDPANPQVIPGGRIDLEAVATDQGDPNDPSAVDSGVGKDKFQFQYAVVNPDGTLGAWQDLAQDGSGETFDDGSRFGPKFANKHGSTGSAGLPSGPDKVYAVRAAAEDGAGNVTDWAAAPVRYVRAGEAGVTEITIIDQSGSMDGTPLRSAIASASAEIGTRNDFDRVGVVSFSSGASVLFPLTTITPGSDVRERAQQTIAGLTATGGTSIGSGLLAAVGMLDSNVSGQTSFVVLTDGQENESPFIADVEGQIPGYVTVHGIALGSGADASAVQQLARSRGGQFFAAADPGDLPAVYARVSGAETGEQDVARRVGSIAPGGRQVMPFSVDDTAGGLTVGVTWPGSDMDLAVIAPDGTVYTHANPGAGRFTVGATAEFFRLPDAAPGTWQAVVNAVDVNPDGEPFEAFARVATPLTAEILTPTQTLNAGDTLPIRVRVSNGPPVLGATASAALIPPDPTSAPPLNVPLFDDGTHGDETANDGVYSNEAVVGAVGGGVYTLQVAVNGPGFVRAPSQQLLVTGGAPANDAPSVSAVGDQVSVGGAAVSVAVAIGDTETPADSLLVTVTSSNQSLLPDSGIVVSGTGAGRLLTLTPVPGQAGSATVTVSVTDTGGRTTSMRFALTAVPTPVAPAPVTPTGLLALGAPAGQIPFVGAFNPDGSLRFVFLAYDPSFLGGVNVTTGDVTGDGVADVVTAPARDTLPLVRVFDGQTGGLVREFFAPGAGLGGVYVAAGDLDGDGFAEIVAGAGTGALVEVFDGRTGAEETPFFAYAPGSVGGVPVFVTDLDGDGSAEIVTVARTGLRSDVRVFRAGGSLVAIFLV